MKTRLLIASMLIALIAASGCESKTSKPDDNNVAEKTADTPEKSSDDEDETAENSAVQEDGEEPAAAGEAQTAGQIPTITGDALNPTLLEPAKVTQGEAPKSFKAKFVTSQGDFVVEFHRDWAPNGVDRAFQLIKAGYYDGITFFRVIPKFMAQFGIHANPKVSAAWKGNTIKDDPVTESNTRGMVTFAKTGMPNSRSTQLFINFGDNSTLDKTGFAPIGKVVEGMDVVDKIYNGYGEGAPRGAGPSQGALTQKGNPYLQESFPKLDFIKKAEIADGKKGE